MSGDTRRSNKRKAEDELESQHGFGISSEMPTMSVDYRRWGRKDSRRSKKRKAEDELEYNLGLGLSSEVETRLGLLLTFAPSSWEDLDTGETYSCVNLYFVTQDGFSFKTKYKFRPYVYDKMELEVEAYLRRRYERQVADIEIVGKEDLDLKNHLYGLQKKYLKVSFDTVQQLMEVKRDLLHILEQNREKFNALGAYESILAGKREQRPQDFLDSIVDLCECDVPYHIRFAIDKDVRSGQWYNVRISSSDVVLEKMTDLLQHAEVRVCAMDIETAKLPLKFPDAEYEQIMMISYMVDGKVFLITNREWVGQDVEDLKYTLKPEFEGYFRVTRVNNEVELLQKWFSHMQEVKPGIYVTYNGDIFNWAFIERRASHHGIKMNEEFGFRCDQNQGGCLAKSVCHLDSFAWVKRDSYFPLGSHGLKVKAVAGTVGGEGGGEGEGTSTGIGRGQSKKGRRKDNARKRAAAALGAKDDRFERLKPSLEPRKVAKKFLSVHEKTNGVWVFIDSENLLDDFPDQFPLITFRGKLGRVFRRFNPDYFVKRVICFGNSVLLRGKVAIAENCMNVDIVDVYQRNTTCIRCKRQYRFANHFFRPEGRFDDWGRRLRWSDDDLNKT